MIFPWQRKQYKHLIFSLQRDMIFARSLEKRGFVIKPMVEDGACLFRAIADQVYGDQEMHSVVRTHCMDYIVSYINEEKSFDSKP